MAFKYRNRYYNLFQAKNNILFLTLQANLSMLATGHTTSQIKEHYAGTAETYQK